MYFCNTFTHILQGCITGHSAEEVTIEIIDATVSGNHEAGFNQHLAFKDYGQNLWLMTPINEVYHMDEIEVLESM